MNNPQVSSKHIVFTYGTLLFEQVLQAVLGRVPERVNCKLVGYIRRPIHDQCYPVVLKATPENVVRGKALLGITPIELALLDKFEDPAYERLLETVHAEPGEHFIARVWTRPLTDIKDIIFDREWDEAHFRYAHQDWYVQQCLEWACIHRLT